METQLATKPAAVFEGLPDQRSGLRSSDSLQVVSPATVSNRVTGGELAVLAIGLAVILATNAALVYSSLPSVDQLIQRLGKFDTDAPPEKRGGRHSLRLRVVGEGQQWR